MGRSHDEEGASQQPLGDESASSSSGSDSSDSSDSSADSLKRREKSEKRLAEKRKRREKEKEKEKKRKKESKKRKKEKKERDKEKRRKEKKAKKHKKRGKDEVDDEGSGGPKEELTEADAAFVEHYLSQRAAEGRGKGGADALSFRDKFLQSAKQAAERLAGGEFRQRREELNQKQNMYGATDKRAREKLNREEKAQNRLLQMAREMRDKEAAEKGLRDSMLSLIGGTAGANATSKEEDWSWLDRHGSLAPGDGSERAEKRQRMMPAGPSGPPRMDFFDREPRRKGWQQ